MACSSVNITFTVMEVTGQLHSPTAVLSVKDPPPSNRRLAEDLRYFGPFEGDKNLFFLAGYGTPKLTAHSLGQEFVILGMRDKSGA